MQSARICSTEMNTISFGAPGRAGGATWVCACGTLAASNRVMTPAARMIRIKRSRKRSLYLRSRHRLSAPAGTVAASGPLLHDGRDVAPAIEQEVPARAVHRDQQAVGKIGTERRRCRVETVRAVRAAGEPQHLCRVIVRAALLPVAAIEVEPAFSGQLIDRNEIALPVRHRVDAETFPILLVAVRGKQRELFRGLRRVGIGMPLVDAGGFIGVVDETELVVHDNGLDLTAAAVRAKAAHEARADSSSAVVVEPVLPQIPLFRSCLRRDDGEDGAVVRTPIESDTHR